MLVRSVRVVLIAGALVASTAVSLAAAAGDPCAGANNATGTTLCGCGKFVPLSVPSLNLGCVGPAGAQGGLIKSVVFASIGDPVVSGGCGTFKAGDCAGDPAKAKAAVEQAVRLWLPIQLVRLQLHSCWVDPRCFEATAVVESLWAFTRSALERPHAMLTWIWLT